MKTIIRNREQGAVAPLVGILMVVFILCVALVVDLGHLHNVKVQLQRAVDATALAGAQQLDGSASQDSDAMAVARATAAVNRVNGITGLVADGGWVDNTSVIVDLGSWDPDNLGESSADRFSSPVDANTANAIKITATLEVDHFFFFLSSGSTVTADAIAVSVFDEQTLPLALVSCVPTGGLIGINRPGLSVCDITTYEFHSDSDDTAAYTSLTFSPASLQTIMEFLDEDGIRTFNQVVYGTGLAHDGIENTAVETSTRTIPVPDYGDTSRGCLGNDGTNINCGLGQEFDTTISPPSDPIDYNPLPRWDMDDPPTAGEPSRDAFLRLLSQNGLLEGDQTALQGLYEETTTPPSFIELNPDNSYKDHRFKKFISLQGGDYKAEYSEVLRYAGYPPVWVNNGTIIPALGAFLDKLVNDADQFKTLLSMDNRPFDSGNEANSGGAGYSVKLTLPVIFAGSCDDWKAVSNGPVSTDNTLFYVGTSDFLLTRAWLTADCYDHGANAINITETSPADGSCGPVASGDYDPAITAGLSFQCGGGHTPNAAIEGVLRPPSRGGELAESGGIMKVYLVE
ncbi:MAG: pilus assembly protein TadG-related protein [Thermodesulfobacteriota bacterium]